MKFCVSRLPENAMLLGEGSLCMSLWKVGNRYRYKDMNDAELWMRMPTVTQRSALSQGLNSNCLPHMCSVCYKRSCIRERGQGCKVLEAFVPVRCTEGLLKSTFAE